MKATFFCVSVLLSMALTSCQRTVTIKEFDSWVRDYENGLHAKESAGDYAFDVQFQPAELMVWQRHNFKSEEEYLKLVSSESKLQRYILTVSLKDKNVDFINQQVSDLAEKQKLLYYFSYGFQEDIYLKESTNSFQCVLYHFERSSDLKNSRTFVLAFDTPGGSENESEIVITSPLFGASPISIKITKNNLPTIQL